MGDDENRDGSKWFDEEDSTPLANCVIKPKPCDESKDEEEVSELVIRKSALVSISKHFHNIVSLVGPPGVGKSTLSSTMYNVMRNDRNDYFEISGESLESFTRGIWSLNEHTKVEKAIRDKINVLDLEGIDTDDTIHYLVVVAMALSKAMLFCADYTGRNPRFMFSIFKTIECGARIFKEKNIRVPKPIIYIQVPFGMTTFKIGKETVDENGLFKSIKKKYKILKDFEMRIFSLPVFAKNRFDRKYQNAVRRLIDEFKNIKEGVPVEQRVKYAEGVIAALNSNSPSIISDMNLKCFQNELKLRIKGIKDDSIVALRQKAAAQQINKKLSFDAYCKLFCPQGLYSFADTAKQLALSLAYYDPKSAKHQKIINDIKGEKYCIDPKVICKDNYENALIRLKANLITKGNNFMKLHSTTFNSFVDLKIAEAKNKIKFKGSTYLPGHLRAAINQKKHELNSELLEKTQNEFTIPDDHLNIDINKKWESEMDTLRAQWEAQISNMKWKRKVTTSGNHKCPNCGNDHTSGVCHKKCGRKALWYWVDGPTNYCMCDGGCNELSQITSVCCWNCGTTLNATIITI